MIYHEMLKYQSKKNWENNVHELRSKCNLPVNYENVCNLIYSMWKNGIRPGKVYGILFTDSDLLRKRKDLPFNIYKLVKAP